MSMSKDLETITIAAIHYAKEHNCNYNIIIKNPEDKGFGDDSTYEYVNDSYFDEDRNCVILDRTDEILGLHKVEEYVEPKEEFVKARTTIITPGNPKLPRKQKKATVIPISGKPRRNGFCPCGSGLKYKRCCLYNQSRKGNRY
jgi:hypothetical protein